MRLDELIQSRKNTNTNIPLETWLKSPEEQADILAANGMPDSMALEWVHTETNYEN